MFHSTRLLAVLATLFLVTSVRADSFDLDRRAQVSNLVRLGRLIEARSLLEGHTANVELGQNGKRWPLALSLAPLARAVQDRELGRTLRNVLLAEGSFLANSARQGTGKLGRQRQIEIAIECFTTVGNLDSDGLYQRGWCYHERGELAAAKADLEAALQLAPDSGPTRALLARTLWRLGDHRAALKTVAQGLQRGGDREGAELFATMLRFAKRKGHVERACELAKRWAERLGVDTASPLHVLVSEIRLERDDLDGAVDAFTRTVPADRPWLVGGVTRATRALAQRGEAGRAAAVAAIGRIPLENEKTPAPLLRLRGDIALEQSDTVGALRSYAAAVTGGDREAIELARQARAQDAGVAPGGVAALLAGHAFVNASGAEPSGLPTAFASERFGAMLVGDELSPDLSGKASWVTRNSPEQRAADALHIMHRTDLPKAAALNIAVAQSSRMPARQEMVRKFLTGDTKGVRESLDGLALVSWQVRVPGAFGVLGMMRALPGSGAAEVAPLTEPAKAPQALETIGEAIAALEDPQASESKRLAKLMEVAGQETRETPRLADPLVIDLDGNGQIDLTSENTQAGSALFDLDGWGRAQQVQWLETGHDGWLVEDRDRNGRITDGTELFGTAGGFADGFEKLARRDANHDGIVAGAELAGLSIWRELERPGQVDAGELVPVEAAGVTSITIPRVGLRTEAIVRGERRLCAEVWPAAVHPEIAAGGDLDLEGI